MNFNNKGDLINQEIELILEADEKTKEVRGKMVKLLKEVDDTLRGLIKDWEKDMYLGKDFELKRLEWMKGSLETAIIGVIEIEELKEKFINTPTGELY